MEHEYIDTSQLHETNELLEEPYQDYLKQRDFVSLAAWQRCREVKIFFYKEIIPLLPVEE